MRFRDYVLLAAVAVCLIAALIYTVRRRKSGGCMGCSSAGGCMGCSSAGGCMGCMGGGCAVRSPGSGLRYAQNGGCTECGLQAGKIKKS